MLTEPYPSPQAGDLCFCVDVQYANEIGYVAVAVWEWGLPTFLILMDQQAVSHEYQPGEFSLREGPLVIAAVQKAEAYLEQSAVLLILDGHGTAHPRKQGLATFVGQELDKATLGVAKDSLLKVPYTLEQEAGAFFPIHWEGDWVGTVLRTQDNVNPIFVSAGYKLSQRQAVDLTFQLRGKYRLIEPIRRADWAARLYAKGEILPPMGVMG